MHFGITLRFSSFRGALTSKPYAFLARPWEFKSVDSIDVFDALGSNIRADVRGDKLLRILPRPNDAINEDWISDRIRFVCDAMRLQRLDTPLLSLGGKYKSLTWYHSLVFFCFAYHSLSSKLSFNSNKLWLSNYSYFFNERAALSKTLLTPPVVDFIGNFLDLESASLWSKLRTDFFGNVFDSGSLKQVSFGCLRNNFLLNQGLGDLNRYSSIILVGFNVKIVAPLLAIRLRNLVKQGVSIYNFGHSSGVVGITDIGLGSDFFKLLKAQHWLSNRLVRSKVSVIFGDTSYLTPAVILSLKDLGFNYGYFAQATGLLSAFEASVGVSNFSASQNINPSLAVFHTNGLISDIVKNDLTSNSNNLRILAASHGGVLASKADFILPVSTFLEQSKFYANITGIKQKTHLVLAAPNGVLDYSESLLLVYVSFFLKSAGYKALYAFFLRVSQISLLVPNNVWVFVNKFFDLFETAHKVSCSVLIRSLFLPDVYLSLPFQKNNIELGVDSLLVLRSPRTVSRFVNAGSLIKDFANLDFYLQDEVSLVSTTLVAASKRLNRRETFI